MKLTPCGLQAPLFAAMTQGHCRILEESEGGLFLKDLDAGIYMLDVADPWVARCWLKRHHCPEMKVMVFQESCWQSLRWSPGWRMTDCALQVVWSRECCPDTEIELMPATLTDVQILLEESGLPEEELLRMMETGRLYAGYLRGRCIGYGGSGSRGSVEFLYVFANCRKHGWGSQLERALIARILAQGLIPYGHVSAGDRAALGLQRRAGMDFCPGYIAWMEPDEQ